MIFHLSDHMFIVNADDSAQASTLSWMFERDGYPAVPYVMTEGATRHYVLVQPDTVCPTVESVKRSCKYISELLPLANEFKVDRERAAFVRALLEGAGFANPGTPRSHTEETFRKTMSDLHEIIKLAGGSVVEPEVIS